MPKFNRDEVIEKANKVHNGRYNYSKFIYKNIDTKCIIICPLHGEFKQTAYHHINRQCGCPKCGYELVSQKLRKSQEEFISEANKVHNNKYQYTKTIYKQNSLKIIITCPLHGDFQQVAQSHLVGNGCPKCAHALLSKTQTKTYEKFLEDVKSVHGEKYSYQKFKYIRWNVKSIIICPIHGNFKQCPNSHMQGSGCPKCSHDKFSKDRSKSKDVFIRDAIEVHDGLYTYEHFIYVNAHKKSFVTCQYHGKFLISAHNHLAGKGCPTCCASHGEVCIRKFLKQNKFQFKQEHRFKDCINIHTLPFDFYIPNIRVAIEYQGLQHYQPVKWFGGDLAFQKLILRDKIKKDYCIHNNIQLIEIRYDENVEDKLTRILGNFSTIISP